MTDPQNAGHTPTRGFYAVEANGRMHVMNPAPSKISICVTAKFDIVTKPDRLREEAHRIARALNREAAHDDLVKALEEIESTPFSMVNDSESLRHSLRLLQQIARTALAKARANG